MLPSQDFKCMPEHLQFALQLVSVWRQLNTPKSVFMADNPSYDKYIKWWYDHFSKRVAEPRNIILPDDRVLRRKPSPVTARHLQSQVVEVEVVVECLKVQYQKTAV